MKKYKYFTIILIVSLSLLRFVNLDNDVPPYNIAGISQTDEPYYCLLGFNGYLEENNRIILELNKIDLKFLMVHNYHLTFSSLKNIGNNYYGLRFGATFLSILTILLLLKIFFERNKNPYLRLLMVLFLFSEFTFFVMSRFQNPQVYAIFWMSLSLYFFQKYDYTALRVFRIFGISIVILIILLVYPYTIFFGFGIALWLANSAIITKSIKPLMDGIVALIISGSIFFLILFLIDSSIEEIMKQYVLINSVRDETIGSNLSDILRSIATQIPFTNLFRFNLFLLFAVLFVLYRGVVDFKNFHISSIHSLIFFVFLGAFAQCSFVSGYPFKKWILLFPVVILALYYLLEELPKINKLNIKDYLIIIITGVISLYSWRVTNSELYWSGMTSYTFLSSPTFIEYLMIVVPVLLLIGLFFYWQKSHYYILILTGMLLLSSTITSYYFILKPTKILKTFLIENSNYMNNSLIIGDFPHAYSLYNNGIVLNNPYDSYFKKIDSNVVYKSINDYKSKVWIIKSKFDGYKAEKQINKYGQDYFFKNKVSNDAYSFLFYSK